MSYNRIWIHANFSTKERASLIHPQFEKQIHDYLKEQLKKCGCLPVIVNGTDDHVHLLFLSTTKMSLDDVMQRVKGATSHFINAQGLCKYKFRWQDGYASFSISESGVDVVQYYITNQKVHHKKVSAERELEELGKGEGFGD